MSVERILHDGIPLAVILRADHTADGIEFFTPDGVKFYVLTQIAFFV